uniref:Ras and Rab interactor 2 n=1 Tax=Electrophorus electricus TaxID=8005 RepID=A0A4W4DWK6_ELEEL
MQEDPVYDYPDPHPVGEKRVCPQRGSLKSISVLDRLLLTYPVWLQLSINSATALHILQREPPGTFLVRKSNTSQKKMLCVRLADESVPSFVNGLPITPPPAFSLETSAISFPDLCRLIAFYCVSRDVLPFTLELPEAIAKASSHKQLESISHMGVEFWSSQLNFRGPRNGPPPLRTRSPSELDMGAGQGALCFINPLFLQDHPAMHKRHHFKRSVKVRVSTENTSSLSPPVSPPPPPPLLAKAKVKGKNLQHLESSSSLSSLDEAEEGPERPPLTRGTSNPTVASLCLPRQSASALRKMSAAFVSFFVPGKRVARLVEDLSRDRRMAFGTLVQDFLRQQREVLKPQFLTSSVELLQGMRIFISQAKVFLLELPEDEKGSSTKALINMFMVADQTLEKALFRCVLKPLKRQIDEALHVLHERDGCSKRIAESMQRARKASPCDLFGVQVTVPDTQGIDKLRRKMSLVRRAYSPIDKLHLLLQICKLIYKAMKNNAEFGADDFLPALSYVIVQCNMPELSVEVEYMMELLDTSWLTGEGGYYLTSVYASLSFIQSLPEAVAPTALTQEVRESLKNWSHRRRTDNKSHKDLLQQVVFQDGECSLMKTLQWKAGTSAETLAQLCAVKFGVNQPEEYSLYWRRDGELEPLPPTAYIQDLQSLGTTSAPFIYQCSGPDMKSRKLTRGGALDLSAEAS